VRGKGTTNFPLRPDQCMPHIEAIRDAERTGRAYWVSRVGISTISAFAPERKEPFPDRLLRARVARQFANDASGPGMERS
jgi:hypothetical protein